MNFNKSHYYFIVLFCFAIGCESNTNERPAITLSEEQTSYTQVGDLEDSSYSNVKRISARITIPLGRNELEVEETLKRAAIEIEDKTNANAVMILAYRPDDDVFTAYTVGRAIYAPNGEWENAAASSPKKISIELNDLYFEDPITTFSIGTSVRLVHARNNEVGLSKEYGSWVDEDIITKVPSGHEATVIEIHSEPMGGQEFIRYKVRVLVNNNEREGWVHENEVTSID